MAQWNWFLTWRSEMPDEKDSTFGVPGLPSSVRGICLPLLAALVCLLGLLVKCDAANAKESSMANDCQVTIYTHNITHPEIVQVLFCKMCFPEVLSMFHWLSDSHLI